MKRDRGPGARGIPSPNGCVRRVPVAEIAGDPAAGYRYRLEDALLRDSIRRFGILMPLAVREGKRGFGVIAGHKRLAAAKTLRVREIPVMLIDRGMSDRDAFLACLVSNWGQTTPDMDRARAVAKAIREFGMTRDEVTETVLPLLGLPADRNVFELYLKTDAVSGPGKALFLEGKLSFRACPAFLRLDREDQDVFAREVAARLRFTASQGQQVLEWLADILKRDGIDLRKLIRTKPFAGLLRRRGGDPRLAADRFHDAVRCCRFPSVSAFQAVFSGRADAFTRDSKNLRIGPVQGFESEGFELHARLRSPEELERLIHKLAGNRSLLNSLFDFKL
ncbi:MAG: Chromosome-partitioning protein Spo0J [Candidatus Omnitrophica bacterium ADurb.Bin314]|nr:MAG: Chromosome-partitioning protein Spo0J [Candidatus Omnitrophica bacterium ADurb.Bin314]